jgi:O-acetyl-ADP-ribose deacetylase (regulator of RNase III)
VEGSVSRIQLWNGDICELEVDAIVSPANPSLWMSTGVGQALKAVAGDEVEFAAIRQLPVAVGDAVVTDGGRLAARLLIHAVSIDRDRRTSGRSIEAAIRSAFARAREQNVLSLALPALGTGVGGFPLDEAARIAVATVRDELRRSPEIATVTFALRGADAYQAFERAINAPVAIDVVAPAAVPVDVVADPWASRVGQGIGEGRS